MPLIILCDIVWNIMSVILELLTLIYEYIVFGPRQANLVLIAYASSEGSGEPAHPRSLARTSAARSYKQWVKRNLQTESQIPGPAEWQGSTVEICHDGMLEDTNSLDGAHIVFVLWRNLTDRSSKSYIFDESFSDFQSNPQYPYQKQMWTNYSLANCKHCPPTFLVGQGIAGTIYREINFWLSWTCQNNFCTNNSGGISWNKKHGSDDHSLVCGAPVCRKSRPWDSLDFCHGLNPVWTMSRETYAGSYSFCCMQRVEGPMVIFSECLVWCIRTNINWVHVLAPLLWSKFGQILVKLSVVSTAYSWEKWHNRPSSTLKCPVVKFEKSLRHYTPPVSYK